MENDGTEATTPPIRQEKSGDWTKDVGPLFELLSKIMATQQQLNEAASSGHPGAVNVIPPSLGPLMQTFMQKQIQEIIQKTPMMQGIMASLRDRGHQGQTQAPQWMPPNLVEQVTQKQQQAVKAWQDLSHRTGSKMSQQAPEVPYWMLNAAMGGGPAISRGFMGSPNESAKKLYEKAPEGGYSGQKAKDIWGSE